MLCVCPTHNSYEEWVSLWCCDSPEAHSLIILPTLTQVQVPTLFFPKEQENRELKLGMETKACITWTLNIKGYNVNMAGSS